MKFQQGSVAKPQKDSFSKLSRDLHVELASWLDLKTLKQLSQVSKGVRMNLVGLVLPCEGVELC